MQHHHRWIGRVVTALAAGERGQTGIGPREKADQARRVAPR
jgi:hypothetical protein